jgi:hypothetical protein
MIFDEKSVAIMRRLDAGIELSSPAVQAFSG